MTDYWGQSPPMKSLSSPVLFRELQEDLEDLSADGIDLSTSPLHSVLWHRIILDEAHKIKGTVPGLCSGCSQQQCACAAGHRPLVCCPPPPPPPPPAAAMKCSRRLVTAHRRFLKRQCGICAPLWTSLTLRG